jgi:DNA-binding response OmpR family regulator
MPNPLVLLIEDDSRLSDTISDLLELLDIDCMAVRDGMTSRASLAGLKPNLVLLDMPVRSRRSLAIIADIRGNLRLRHTKLVLITADEYADAPEYRLADAVLMKPFAVGDLEAVLLRLLGHSQPADMTPPCTNLALTSSAKG